MRAVLTGRIEQQGDDLIISAELVRVADGALLWGKRYSRRTAGLLAMQQEIARAISQHLQLRLSGEQARQLNKGGTSDNEAYKLYLRGRYSWNKRTADDIRKAIELFQQAIDKDPNYAELDPLSPSMGANLGRAYLNLGETDAAITECKRALELNPNFPLAHHFMGLTYVEQRRYEDAIAEFQQAVASSKRADLFVAGLGIGYAMAGKRAEALGIVRELEEKYAKKEATGFDLALVHAALANDDEAIAWLEKDFTERNMSGLIYVESTVIHQRLHNDPRYQDLLRRMHL